MTCYIKKIRTYKNFPIKGINYLDLNGIYLDNSSRDHLVEDCIKTIHPYLESFDYFGLIEARGFLIGSIIADKLKKGIVLCRSKKNRRKKPKRKNYAIIPLILEYAYFVEIVLNIAQLIAFQ